MSVQSELENGKRQDVVHWVRLFLTGLILSFASQIGRTVFFRSEILSFELLSLAMFRRITLTMIVVDKLSSLRHYEMEIAGLTDNRPHQVSMNDGLETEN